MKNWIIARSQPQEINIHISSKINNGNWSQWKKKCRKKLWIGNLNFIKTNKQSQKKSLDDPLIISQTPYLIVSTKNVTNDSTNMARNKKSLQIKNNIKDYWISKLYFLNCYNYFVSQKNLKSQVWPPVLVHRFSYFLIWLGKGTGSKIGLTCKKHVNFDENFSFIQGLGIILHIK